jgi:hypothetical protein
MTVGDLVIFGRRPWRRDRRNAVEFRVSGPTPFTGTLEVGTDAPPGTRFFDPCSQDWGRRLRLEFAGGVLLNETDLGSGPFVSLTDLLE